MNFRFPSHQIHEIVSAQKCVREGQRAIFESYGEKGKKLKVDLDLMDGPFLDLRLVITAGACSGSMA